MQYNTVKLDGKNRIQLINDTQAGDLQQDPANSIQVLFRNDDVRREVRDIIYDAFSEYLIVDPTHLGHLRLKLSKVESLVIQEKNEALTTKPLLSMPLPSRSGRQVME